MSGIGVRGVRLQSCFFSSASPLWAKLVGSSFLWLSTARNYQRYCLSYVWLHTFNTAALRIQQENHFQHPPPTKKKKKCWAPFLRTVKLKGEKSPAGRLCSVYAHNRQSERSVREIIELAIYLYTYVCVYVRGLLSPFFFFFRERHGRGDWKHVENKKRVLVLGSLHDETDVKAQSKNTYVCIHVYKLVPYFYIEAENYNSECSVHDTPPPSPATRAASGQRWLSAYAPAVNVPCAFPCQPSFSFLLSEQKWKSTVFFPLFCFLFRLHHAHDSSACTPSSIAASLFFFF